jgi:hypothetical protein
MRPKKELSTLSSALEEGVTIPAPPRSKTPVWSTRKLLARTEEVLNFSYLKSIIKVKNVERTSFDMYMRLGHNSF